MSVPYFFFAIAGGIGGRMLGAERSGAEQDGDVSVVVS